MSPVLQELAAAEEEARAAGRRAEELAALCGQQGEALRDKVPPITAAAAGLLTLVPHAVLQDGELEQLKRYAISACGSSF